MYGVTAPITFRQGDARALVPTLGADILFVDPPWREDYDKRRTTLADLPLLEALLQGPLASYDALWAKVPPSFELASVPGAQARAFFGAGKGDAERVKFVLLTVKAPGRSRNP